MVVAACSPTLTCEGHSHRSENHRGVASSLRVEILRRPSITPPITDIGYPFTGGWVRQQLRSRSAKYSDIRDTGSRLRTFLKSAGETRIGSALAPASIYYWLCWLSLFDFVSYLRYIVRQQVDSFGWLVIVILIFNRFQLG